MKAGRRWAWAMMIGAMAFVALAGYRIDAPGLYADEMLFAPAALEALGHCAIDAPVSVHVSGCFPLYLNPPYLGALKAWLYAPLLALVEPSPAVLRWPMVLLAALTIVGWAHVARNRFGTPVGLALLMLMALDPAYAIHAHLDWGPVVIAGWFKLCLLAALWRWLAVGSTLFLIAIVVFAMAGIYDKLNFVWVIAAFGSATLMVYPRQVMHHVRARRPLYWSAFAATCAVLAVPVAIVLVRASRLQLPGTEGSFDWFARCEKINALVNTALSGDFVLPWIAGAASVPVSWPMTVLASEALALLLIVALRPWKVPALQDRMRGVLWVSISIVLLLLALVATPQAGGAHHAIVLWPLPWLNAVLMIDLLTRLLVRDRYVRVATPVALAILVAAAAPVYAARHLELRALWRGEHGFVERFDPASRALAAVLATRDARWVIVTDWGLHQPLMMLSPAADRGRLLDWWPVFNDVFETNVERNTKLSKQYLGDSPLLLVSFASGRAIMPATQANLPAHLAAWQLCVDSVETIRDSQGRPLYEIRGIRRGDGSCAGLR